MSWYAFNVGAWPGIFLMMLKFYLSSLLMPIFIYVLSNERKSRIAVNTRMLVRHIAELDMKFAAV